MVETISSKLCGGETFDPKETKHVFAVLGQQFGLNVSFGHPDSAALVDTGVVNRLRICHSMTLENDIRHGVVELGRCGELTSWLLWLLAKDLYIRDRLHEPSEILTKTLDGDLLDTEVTDCKMILIVDWLEFVFGKRIWDKTRGSREHFQDAFLNFSHWVSMTNTIAGSGDDDHVE